MSSPALASGVGGHALVQPGPGDVPPGTGVLGQGGRMLEKIVGRLLLGTGVIGVGGDADNKDLPLASEAGSADVFGQGTDAQLKSIVDASGGSVFDGPAEPCAGVIGRGEWPTMGGCGRRPAWLASSAGRASRATWRTATPACSASATRAWL